MSLRQLALAAHLPLRLLAILGIVVAVGCGILDPKKDHKPPPPPFQYPDLKTPQHVLENVALVWAKRDSVRVGDLYASDYLGSSTDATDNSVLTFTRDNEIAVIAGLRRDVSITNVIMDFKAESTWTLTTYPTTDPPGWIAIDLPPGVTITVDKGVIGSEVAQTATFLEFKFRPTAIAGTDTTWGIVRWTEVATSKQ